MPEHEVNVDGQPGATRSSARDEPSRSAQVIDTLRATWRKRPFGRRVTYEHVIEQIRAAQSRYVQALDDGRPDDVAETFCVDGVTDIDGVGVFEGRDAIREAYRGWGPPQRPQRHVVSNVVVEDWNDSRARATTDVAFVQLLDTGWAITIVARYHDVVRRDDDGTWRFLNRTTRFVSAPDRGAVEVGGAETSSDGDV